MKKKKLAYMLAVTQDYVFAAGNIALSLMRHNPKKDFDICIFYDHITEEDRRIFNSFPNCHLYAYNIPVGFEREIRAKCPKFNDEKFAKHFSFLKFAKFEIFDLLDKYHHVIWLDADVTIQADPGDCMKYMPFAITIDKDWTVQNNFTAPIEGYDMTLQGSCSAVFMISDELANYQAMKAWCYDMAVKVCPYFKNIDQGIINLLLQHFHIPYQWLPLEVYQCMPDYPNATYAKIVHFGPHKIWKEGLVASAFPEWCRTHADWLKRGGSDYARPKEYKLSRLTNCYAI